jgi:ABC-type multidrug transport system fused ATPase/permease subunit
MTISRALSAFSLLQDALNQLLVANNKKQTSTTPKAKERLRRTTIIIAHRLTTIRSADRIVVLGRDLSANGQVTIITLITLIR